MFLYRMERFLNTIFRIAIVPAACLAFFSCSTTRVLQDGEYRLQKNKILITNQDEKKFNANDLEPYIKQSPNSYFIFGWNPFLNIYNWSNGKGNGWDRFVRKIGEPPVVYDPDMVESSVSNITDHLTFLGYYNSDVRARIDVRKKRVKVTYNVTLGKQFPIKGITYHVPEGELAADFWADTSSLSVRPGDYMSEYSLDKETDMLSKYFRDNGFYGFTKNYISYVADTLSCPDSAFLEMHIREYTRNETEQDARPFRKFSIGEVTITYPLDMKVRENVLRSLNTIRPGNRYSESEVNNTYSRISALNMFSSVNVEMTQSDTSVVDCSINLTKSRLQGFKVNAEVSTNSSGLFGVSPQISYFHKNIFSGGEWLNLSFMGNFQFKFNDPTRSTELGISAGISFPKFLFLPDRIFHGAIPRTDLNLSYNYQSRPEYTRNIISTSFGYSWNTGGRFYYTLSPIQLNIINLFNIDQGFYDDLSNNPYLQSAYQNHFDLGLGATVYYTTDNSVNPKNSYFYSRFQFDIAGNLLSLFNPLMPVDENGSHMIWNTPYSQFFRAELSFVKTWVFGKKGTHSLAMRALGGIGYSYGNSDAMPFEKQFYAGGASSLRGWQSRAVGPGMSPMNDNFVIPNQTGDIRLEANVEYRFRIFWKIAGAVFMDAGNVWNLRSSVPDDTGVLRGRDFFKSLAWNWGAGIRLDLDFVLLRLDMGIRIYDPAKTAWVSPSEWFGPDTFALHFGVGYPF